MDFLWTFCGFAVDRPTSGCSKDDRLSPDDWVDAGARLMDDVAHDYVTEVLNRPKPDHITPEADARIRETFPIHLAPIR